MWIPNKLEFSYIIKNLLIDYGCKTEIGALFSIILFPIQPPCKLLVIDLSNQF